MKRHFFIAATLIIASACSESLQEAADITPSLGNTHTIELSPEELSLVERIANNTPKINQESAQASAMNLLGLEGEASTHQMMSAVFCNQKKVFNSLTKSYNTTDDTAFYLFNMPDKNGFAIIAADLRVPNQVLAYSDNGNFDTDTDKPGMQLFLELAKDYVAQCIAIADAQEDSLTESICQKLGIEADTSQHGLRTKSKILQKIKCTMVGYPTETIENIGSVRPMLNTLFGQEEPYNQKSGVQKAGCAPIAVSQLLAYWHYPAVIDGVIMDWDVINKGINNDYYANQVATLVNFVRKGLGTDGSSTKSHKVIKFFQQIRCSSQNQYYDYKYYKVIDALKEGKPVFMRGDGNNKNHAWIVDGYLERRIIKEEVFKYCIVEQSDDGTITAHEEDIPSRTSTMYKLLHINWGWYGRANGYYNQGVFDTDRAMIEGNNGYFRETTAILNDRHYYKNVEIITDIKPRY